MKEARANVRILVGPQIDPKRQFKRVKAKNLHHRRSRREFSNEIVLTLKENHSLGLLEEVVYLSIIQFNKFDKITNSILKHKN